MSRLIHILNAVKITTAKLQITPSQLAAYQAVSDALHRYGQCNLHSTVACGKTFLGWHIARESGGVYLTSPSLLETTRPQPLGIVIDNASEHRDDYRRTLAIVQVRRSFPLLTISRLPVEEDMPQVLLGFVPDDLDTVIRNLRQMGFNVLNDTYADFWEVMVKTAGGLS